MGHKIKILHPHCSCQRVVEYGGDGGGGVCRLTFTLAVTWRRVKVLCDCTSMYLYFPLMCCVATSQSAVNAHNLSSVGRASCRMALTDASTPVCGSLYSRRCCQRWQQFTTQAVFESNKNKRVSYRKQIARQHSSKSKGMSFRSEVTTFPVPLNPVWSRRACMADL